MARTILSASLRGKVPKAKTGLTTASARALSAKISAALQKKYAAIRANRPALGKGITVDDLMNFYFVPELQSELQKHGIASTAKKRVLCHRVAAWINNGQQLTKNQRYVPTGHVSKPRAKKGQAKATRKTSVKATLAPVAAPPRTSMILPPPSGPAFTHAALAPLQQVQGTGQVVGYRHEHKWQYEDKAKANGPWHDYDVAASDLVEDAYVDWKKDPHIDVRAVKSGEWEYMVDFNQMEQQNVKHTAHTRRKVRRVNVASNQLAHTEGNEIRKRVQAQRAAAGGKR